MHIFQHKEQGLCLTFPGLMWLGFPENTLKKGSTQKSPSWPFIDHPEDGRKKLLPYEMLPAKKKAEVSHKLRQRMGCQHAEGEACTCGDIYHYTAIEPIKEMIIKDLKAESFFLAYTYINASGQQEPLPMNKIQHYTNEASILNMIDAAEKDAKAIIKGKLGMKSVTDFWQKVIEIIKIEKSKGNIGSKFPTSYERLIAAKNSALKEYRTKGYAALIHGLYGKQNAAKVNDEVSVEQLKSLLKDPTQKDDVLICMLYNLFAEKNGYKTITPATVGNKRNEWAPEIDLDRYGRSYVNEKYIRQVKGILPSHPLALVEHDDNNLDLLFQDGKYQFHRYVAMVVIDSRFKLVLGKSYIKGDTPEQWQVGHAYLDAMYYIRSLTGGWYLPFEIKADRWAQTNLTPFYNSISKHMVTPGFGNKHRGYIEPFFGSNHWKRCQQLVSEGNWSGNNLTAKYSGVNPDMLDLSRREKTRPTIGHEAELQIERFVQLLRQMPAFTREHMNAPSKEQQWLEAWNNLHEDDKRPINDMQFLLKFGITHKPKHTDTIMISNRGVEPQIKGVKYSYDLPETEMYRRYAGAKVQVIYDPYDMSRVLITNHDDIHFIAKEAKLVPRALKDHYTGSRTYLNAILDEKVQQWGDIQKIGKRQEARDVGKLVANGYGAAEAILKGGGLIKELKNSAEQVAISNGNDTTSWEEQEEFINKNYDIDRFF